MYPAPGRLVPPCSAPGARGHRSHPPLLRFMAKTGDPKPRGLFLTLALRSSAEFLLFWALFQASFSGTSLLWEGEHWSRAEHIQKRPFRDELRGRRRKAPSHWHRPPLPSAVAELEGVLAISAGKGKWQPRGSGLAACARDVAVSPGPQACSSSLLVTTCS